MGFNDILSFSMFSAVHSTYGMFSWCKYLSVFPPLGLLSGNFFLIVPFLDYCLLVLFYEYANYIVTSITYHVIKGQCLSFKMRPGSVV